ncbi:HNH endonuclease [Bosea sp. NPDC003192]|uniref:HNH endonuclease n=1 Tax=Bosea sp. NPDC003192 TaxID=3390551 RepID=UPI003D07B242
MDDSEFDRPIFKVLPKNDSGKAGSHQAGFVVPKPLAKYFPELGPTSAANPSVYQDIKAALFLGSKPLGVVTTRYQYQTWKGTRLERRVTNNLSEWQKGIDIDDLLIIEQSLTDPLFYRFTAYDSESKEAKSLAPLIAGRRWGVLDLAELPVSTADVDKEEALQIAREAAPFQMFDPTATPKEKTVKKVSRSRAFQKRVMKEYGGQCCLCGKGLKNASNVTEGEAAHIIPRSQMGSDDVRNGLLLCRAHHWAFDQGMYGIKPDSTITVHSLVSGFLENKDLAGFDGKKLALPATATLAPDKSAFAWHLEKIFNKSTIQP